MDKYTCPLCQSSSSSFYKNEFYLCDRCRGIFRPKNLLPTEREEKKRYELHNNDCNDTGYLQFVTPITNKIVENHQSTEQGLDFGSGPSSAISKILLEKKYQIHQYDPFFANNENILQNQFDYIACCEVMEHFHNPQKEFTLLKKLLKPKGKLYCMTHLYDQTIDFDKWYYKNDFTHVFIYQEGTINYIKNTFLFQSVSIKKRLICFS